MIKRGEVPSPRLSSPSPRSYNTTKLWYSQLITNSPLPLQTLPYDTNANPRQQQSPIQYHTTHLGMKRKEKRCNLSLRCERPAGSGAQVTWVGRNSSLAAAFSVNHDLYSSWSSYNIIRLSCGSQSRDNSKCEGKFYEKFHIHSLAPFVPIQIRYSCYNIFGIAYTGLSRLYSTKTQRPFQLLG